MMELIEMLYLQTTAVWLDDSALMALLGNVHKTSYAEGMRLSVESYRASATKAQALWL